MGKGGDGKEGREGECVQMRDREGEKDERTKKVKV